MNDKPAFDSAFEPALVKEMHQFGEIKHFKEGDIVMDYGKYIRMMPIILKGTIKVFRMDDSGKEILLYYLCFLILKVMTIVLLIISFFFCFVVFF